MRRSLGTGLCVSTISCHQHSYSHLTAIDEFAIYSIRSIALHEGIVFIHSAFFPDTPTSAQGPTYEGKRDQCLWRELLKGITTCSAIAEAACGVRSSDADAFLPSLTSTRTTNFRSPADMCTNGINAQI